MKHTIALILLTIFVSGYGCASSRKVAGPANEQRPEQGPAAPSYGESQQERLADAVRLLVRGNTKDATELLAAICAEPGVPGVTDEALFRLTLLRLGPETAKEGIESARLTAERLQKEYPISPWSRQAAPLLELLASTGDLAGANRNLKSLNLSLSQEVERLTRESKELRERLEKLKDLDLELEGKAK